MKRWFVVLLAAVLLCTAACNMKAAEKAGVPDPTETPASEPTEEPTPAPTAEPTPEPSEAPSCAEAIVGEWKIVSVEIGENSFDPKEVGMDSSVVFYPNGAGTFTLTVAHETETSVVVYTAEGNTITMIDDTNESLTAIYDPETNTIRLSADGVVTVVLAPKGDEPDGEEWKTVELEQFVSDDGMEMVAITAAVPAGATLRIDFPNQEDYVYVSDKNVLSYRKVKIPVPVFYPNAPVESEEMTIVPKITVTLSEGGEFDVECPAFTVRFPTLLIAFDTSGEPVQGEYRVKANTDGKYQLYGFVRSNEEGSPSVAAGVQLTVNGEVIPVYEGGIFLADLPVIDNAPTAYTLIAEKSNYVTATVEVVVEP